MKSKLLWGLYIVIFVFFIFLLQISPSFAHIFAPSLYELKETGAMTVTAKWKEPVVRPKGTSLRPVLPPDCEGVGKVDFQYIDTGAIATWNLKCSGGLIGKSVSVDNIATSQADVLLRVELLDGRSISHILTADDSSFTIPKRQSSLSVFKTYLVIGTAHILEGLDHLLFILGLVLIIGWSRQLLWTVSAFTLGHSVTLALAVLGFVHIPQELTETAIALSIYFLAIELYRSYKSHNTLMNRYPWIIAGLFGLLHGLGFAGALNEIGLPQADIPLALLSFNIGIEIGQLLFVVLVLIVWFLLKRSPIIWPRFAKIVPAYLIGSLAVFWFLERIWSAFFSFQ